MYKLIKSHTFYIKLENKYIGVDYMLQIQVYIYIYKRSIEFF